ncbi:hypothetical protein AG1IA_02007 [Rhizoctonia solani AG-1 IA]|uniref:Uncharacterized protein n=1 Tax=Thanatephorus cucumeris (strain AG1-IA) TaxID=983506 RepID=L8X0W3_THACA|nr:hypothetical protein AG1IA_02007 [Rhizoctonia solani AG-1 IA]
MPVGPQTGHVRAPQEVSGVRSLEARLTSCEYNHNYQLLTPCVDRGWPV